MQATSSTKEERIVFSGLVTLDNSAFWLQSANQFALKGKMERVTRDYADLGRRERQIMDVVHRLGSATAVEVARHVPDAPSAAAVRGMLRYLEGKGFLSHSRDGARYVYHPTARPRDAQKWAISQVVKTFFGGSRTRAVAALLEVPDSELTEDDLDRLTKRIQKHRRRAQ